MKKNVIVSWSSGKDSTLVLERLLENPNYQVTGLFTTYVKDEVPFQATPLDVLEMQAQLTGLPLIKIELPSVFPANELYQSTIIAALKASSLPIDAVAFGDMFCNGIAEYRRGYIEPAGWQCVFPLLGESSEQLAQEILERGIQTLVVTTDGQSLPSEYCGMWYNQGFLQQLPEHVDPCGENGEFHTFVVASSAFNGQIQLTLADKQNAGRFCYQRYQAKILPNSIETV